MFSHSSRANESNGIFCGHICKLDCIIPIQYKCCKIVVVMGIVKTQWHAGRGGGGQEAMPPQQGFFRGCQSINWVPKLC